MDKLRMRTTLSIRYSTLSFGCTVVSLLVIRTIVQNEVRAILSSDLRHSVKTYQNLQRQRRELLSRESGALLADLPTLKALMTTHDVRTIEDAGVEFWRVSGSDLFALLDRTASSSRRTIEGLFLIARWWSAGSGKPARPDEPILLAIGDRLFSSFDSPTPLWRSGVKGPPGFCGCWLCR